MDRSCGCRNCSTSRRSTIDSSGKSKEMDLRVQCSPCTRVWGTVRSRYHAVRRFPLWPDIGDVCLGSIPDRRILRHEIGNGEFATIHHPDEEFIALCFQQFRALDELRGPPMPAVVACQFTSHGSIANAHHLRAVARLLPILHARKPEKTTTEFYACSCCWDETWLSYPIG